MEITSGPIRDQHDLKNWPLNLSGPGALHEFKAFHNQSNFLGSRSTEEHLILSFNNDWLKKLVRQRPISLEVITRPHSLETHSQLSWYLPRHNHYSPLRKCILVLHLFLSTLSGKNLVFPISKHLKETKSYE